MDYSVTVKEIGDYWGDVYGQEVYDEHGKMLYNVHNLTDCPEDAVIYRDLFSAYDWIDAIKFGMKLAEQGYDSIVVNDVTEEQE